MSAVAIFPTSGNITATETVCKVNVTEAPPNDATTYDAENTPSMDPIVYYLKLSATGEDDLVSQRFTTSQAELFQWDNVIFPAAGSWTLDLCLDADDSVEATAAVTVN